MKRIVMEKNDGDENERTRTKKPARWQGENER
jgi:hypothetical protein